MNDLEICKRIAEIERHEFYVLKSELHEYPSIKVFTEDVNGKYWASSMDYNPLTDKALCFDLMVKYLSGFDVRKPRGKGNNYFQAFYRDNSADCKTDENPQKAICLAIIEAHSNDN